MLTTRHPASWLRRLPAPAAVVFAAALLAPAAVAIQFTEGQRETAVELVEQLEQRHYSKLRYDDELASAHLDSYLDSLDGGRMFFTQADIREFERFRTTMDDDMRRGRLEAGLVIFNRFEERLVERLEQVLDTLEDQVAAMDFSVDEEVVIDASEEPWAGTRAELDDRWRKQLKNQVLRLRLAEKEPEEIVPTLRKRYENQLSRVRQYNSQDAFQIYANALTELYDPHTNYFSPRRSENFNINMSLSLEGIGAVLQLEDEYTKVARLVPAGPAEKQGELKPSDRIVGVGQGDDGEIQDVVGWRLDEVVELIRGPKGSVVRLEVIPADAPPGSDHRTIAIVRNTVKLEEQAAHKRILELPSEEGAGSIRIGVIDIPAFYVDFEAMRRGDEDYRSTTRDVRRLLGELEREGIDGLIIDLRNNGGGSLQEANDLTGLFIEHGPTVQIRHSSRRVWRDGKRVRSAYYDGPLLVMINRLSASASEIFAGAIQDYERGLIVGDRSFGKGTVQTLVPLAEGQLKITESKFYRISGDSTQHRGVVPDIEFPSLFDPEEIGESALEHALSWDQINPVRHRHYGDVDAVLPRLAELFEHRRDSNPEFAYLEEQRKLVAEGRDRKTLPLNEEKRRALRREREARALALENQRRVARGEEPIDSFDGLTSDDEEASASAEHSIADENAADSGEGQSRGDGVADGDVLLLEAGHILADALLLGKQAFALREAEES